jgi:hypothetical protein
MTVTFVVRGIQTLLLGLHCKRAQGIGEKVVKAITRALATHGRDHLFVAPSRGESPVVVARDVDVGSYTKRLGVHHIQVQIRCTRGAEQVNRVG